MYNLNKIRADVESFCSEINEEYYLNGAGLKDELNISAIYTKYKHLFDRKLILEVQKKRKQAKGEEERKLRYLQAFFLEYYLGNAVKELTDEAETMQTAGTIRANGEKIPFRLAQIKMINEPNRVKREVLYKARNNFINKINVPLLKRMQKLHETAKVFGYTNYMTLFKDMKSIDFQALENIMQGFIERTESVYVKRMNEELKVKIGVELEDAEKHDVSFLFRAKEFDKYFRKDQMLSILKRMLSNVGIRVEDQKSIQLDIEERPKKSPRAFCTPIKIPEDVKLMLMPHGGHDDYATLFHETGHAEHFASVKPDLAVEYKWLGDNSVTESYAFLLEYLLTDENWLKQNIKMTETKEYLRFLALYKLLSLRSYGAKLSYEIKLHTSSSLQGINEAHKRIGEKVLKYRHPANHYLTTVDDAFYSAQYLQAWIFEAQLRKFLKREFGNEWFNSQEAGKYLTNLWRDGLKYSVTELAKTIRYAGLDVEPLTASILEPLR
jgi:oligoendopeptidase F